MKKITIIALSVIVLGFSGYCVAQNTNQATPPESIKIPPLPDSAEQPAQESSKDLANIAIVTSGNEQHNFKVEIADTFEDTRKGLMFRRTLDADKGMLFIFDVEQERRFWMKNTYIPLDIIFIRSDGVIRHIAHMTTPHSLEHIPSNGPALAVLEIAGGQAKQRNINIGDRVSHSVFKATGAE